MAFGCSKRKQARLSRFRARTPEHAHRCGPSPLFPRMKLKQRCSGFAAVILLDAYTLTSRVTPTSDLVAREALSMRCQVTSLAVFTLSEWRPARAARRGIRNDDSTGPGPLLHDRRNVKCVACAGGNDTSAWHSADEATVTPPWRSTASSVNGTPSPRRGPVRYPT